MFRNTLNEVWQSQWKQTACHILLLVVVSNQAQAHETPSSVQQDGRFTPNQLGEVFPPQHREIDNVRWYTPEPERHSLSPRSNMTADQVDKLAQDVANDPQVAPLLGERHAHVSSKLLRDKSSGSDSRYQVIYFNYTDNQTVVVRWQEGLVESIDVRDASEDQPALSQAEMDQAIALAVAHWDSRGVSRVHALVGYAIQTFQADGSPFASRMAYVSFHTSTPEVPELLTWVDLSTESVVRSEVAQ